MTVTGRERFLLIAAVVAGAAVGLYLAIDGWVLPTIRENADAIDTASREIEALKREVALLPAREAAFNEAVGRALVFTTPVAAEGFFVNKLNTFARQAQMETPNIEPLAPKRESFYDVISFNLRVRAPLDRLLKFVELIERDTAAQRIESLTIVPSGRHLKREDPLQATMRVSAVVVPPEGKKPARRGPTPSAARDPRDERRLASAGAGRPGE